MKVLTVDIESDILDIEDSNITFRPSPNFKNMKKFLKFRMDQPDHYGQMLTPLADSPESPPPLTNEEAMATLPPPQPDIQPPLPLDPPPSDNPPLPPDVVCESSKSDQSAAPLINVKDESELAPIKLKTETVEESEDTTAAPPKPPMCRDFIKGTCTRPGCKYVHKCDLSQLYGVFTFCRNYQNTVCTLPNCRYMHATVFEEQRFYRTGVLPASVSNKNNNSTGSNVNTNSFSADIVNNNFVLQPPPPPPPPPSDSEEVKANKFSINLSNPPPQILPKVVETMKPLNIINCPPPIILEPRVKDTIIEQNSTASGLKRNWAEIDEVNTSAHKQEASAKRTNIHKCENCVRLENRLQYAKAKIEVMTKSSAELDNKMKLLDRKNNRLVTCVVALLQAVQLDCSGVQSVNGMMGHANIAQLLQNGSIGDHSGQMKSDHKKVNLMADQLRQLIQITFAKKNASDKSIKTFQIPNGNMNGIQNEQPSVNLASLNASRQLTNFFNGWGNHRT